MARPRLPGVHSFELVTVAFAAGVLVLLRIQGLSVDPASAWPLEGPLHLW